MIEKFSGLTEKKPHKQQTNGCISLCPLYIDKLSETVETQQKSRGKLMLVYTRKNTL